METTADTECKACYDITRLFHEDEPCDWYGLFMIQWCLSRRLRSYLVTCNETWSYHLLPSELFFSPFLVTPCYNHLLAACGRHLLHPLSSASRIATSLILSSISDPLSRTDSINPLLNNSLVSCPELVSEVCCAWPCSLYTMNWASTVTAGGAWKVWCMLPNSAALTHYHRPFIICNPLSAMSWFGIFNLPILSISLVTFQMIRWYLTEANKHFSWEVKYCRCWKSEVTTENCWEYSGG